MHPIIPFFFLQCAEHIILITNSHFLQYSSRSNINNIYIQFPQPLQIFSLCEIPTCIYLTLHKNMSRFLYHVILVQRTIFLNLQALFPPPLIIIVTRIAVSSTWHNVHNPLPVHPLNPTIFISQF